MASDQNTGAIIAIVAKAPQGDEKRLFQGVNEQTGPAGSPDGVQATVKDNELPYMPKGNFVLKGGDKLIVKVTLKVADGIDASDCVFNIPVMRNGSLEYLSTADFNFTTDYPASTPASQEIPLGAGYTVPEGDTLVLGGGKYFISVENDTA
jgi:hypothetical protein